jgi:hypothetical protein
MAGHPATIPVGSARDRCSRPSSAGAREREGQRAPDEQGSLSRRSARSDSEGSARSAADELGAVAGAVEVGDKPVGVALWPKETRGCDSEMWPS